MHPINYYERWKNWSRDSVKYVITSECPRWFHCRILLFSMYRHVWRSSNYTYQEFSQHLIDCNFIFNSIIIRDRNHKVTYKNTETLARVSTVYNDEVSLNDVPSHKKYFLQLLRAITIISFCVQRNKRRHKFWMVNSIFFTTVKHLFLR